MNRYGLLWLAACLAVHLVSPAGADQPLIAGRETVTPTGAEAKGLGIDHYEVSFVDTKPHIKIFGSDGNQVGVLDITWGPGPDEQILHLEHADGTSIWIHWKPAAGLFELSQPNGEEAKRELREGKWVIDPKSDRLIEENKDAIAIAAVAAADYLRNTGQGVPKPRHGSGPGGEGDPGQ